MAIKWPCLPNRSVSVYTKCIGLRLFTVLCFRKKKYLNKMTSYLYAIYIMLIRSLIRYHKRFFYCNVSKGRCYQVMKGYHFTLPDLPPLKTILLVRIIQDTFYLKNIIFFVFILINAVNICTHMFKYYFQRVLLY